MAPRRKTSALQPTASRGAHGPARKRSGTDSPTRAPPHAAPTPPPHRARRSLQKGRGNQIPARSPLANACYPAREPPEHSDSVLAGDQLGATFPAFMSRPVMRDQWVMIVVMKLARLLGADGS